MAESGGTVTSDAPDSGLIAQPKRILSHPLATEGFLPLPGLVVLFGAFFVVTYAIFHPGFHSRMIYDSESLILGNAALFARGNLLEIISIVPQRPLFMLSLLGNYWLAGMDPFSFRLFNAAVLAAAGTALAILIASILETPALEAEGTKRDKRCVALALALLFVVHPVQCFGVLYIWQRAAIMACFFYFAALAAYVVGRSGRWGRPTPAYILSSALCLAGILSKENLATLPLMMILVELILFKQDFRQIIRRICVIAALIIPPLALQVALTHSLYGAATSIDQQGVLPRVWLYYRKAGVTLFEVVLTECRVAFSYLSMIVAPFLQGLQILRAETISRSLWVPPVTMAAVAGVMGLAGFAVWERKRFPVAALGVMFFFIGLAPESLLIPQYFFFCHRAILPMAGLLLVMAQGAMALLAYPAWKGIRAAVCAAMLTLVVGMSVMSVSYARQWNPGWLWMNAFDHLPSYSPDVEKYPYQDVLVGYGGELSRSGNYRAAIGLLKEAMEVDSDPKNDKTLLAMGNLGMALFRSGKHEEGLDLLRNAVELSPRSAWMRYNLGIALTNSGNKEEGVDHLRQAARLYPTDPEIRLGLADVLQESGEYAEADEQYREAVKLDPHLVTAHENLGKLLLRMGRPSEAIASFERALAIAGDKEKAELFNELGMALAASGKTAEARAAFEKALALNPDHAAAGQNLDKLLQE